MNGDADAEGVVVPWEQLSPDALRGIIEEFVSREATEYGMQDVEFETKVAQVRAQIERGEVVVLFDPRRGTANLAPARDVPG